MGFFSRRGEPPNEPEPPIRLELGPTPDDLDGRENELARALAPLAIPGAPFRAAMFNASRDAAAHYLPEGPLAVALCMKVTQEFINGIQSNVLDFNQIDHAMGITGTQLAAARIDRRNWMAIAGPVENMKSTIVNISQGQLATMATADENPRFVQGLVGTLMVARGRLGQ